MKLRILQYVNKTPWLHVQQGKCPPINIQNSFSFAGVYLFTFMILFGCFKKKEQPELLTPPLSLLYEMERDQNKEKNWFVA